MSKLKKKVVHIEEIPGILGEKPELFVNLTDCSTEDAIPMLQGVLAGLLQQWGDRQPMGEKPKTVTVGQSLVDTITGMESLDLLLRKT